MINPPLRCMLTLVCLADTRNFRRAAERLRISQPAVSAHIRDLERHFGVPLVHRTTRQVVLTVEGAAFAARAKRAFDDLEMASQDLKNLAAVHRGRVVAACIPPMMANVVPAVIRRMNTEYRHPVQPGAAPDRHRAAPRQRAISESLRLSRNSCIIRGMRAYTKSH